MPDVTVKPAGLAIISINDELQKKGISSWATLNGYVELQYTWPWNPFCATVRNVDVAHSLIFTYPLRATAPSATNLVTPISAPPTHTVEGMWWKQEKNVTGFIAIANLASQPANATIQVTDGHGLLIGQHSVSVTPHGMNFIQLPELQTSEATNGGVRITSSETSDNLVINGGLEDQTIGYSAGMPFASEPLMQSEPEPVTMAELGLMSGAADPMMLFPAGTTFTPYSVLRNVSDAALSIAPTLWWMEGGAPHSALLPQITLPSLQTQSLDVASLLALFGPKNFNGSFNIAFETQARRGSLVMASGSVDQAGTYVFEVGPRGVGESASKSLQQWSTGNGDDTMVTVWNPADEAQDFVFTLFFDGGHYLLPLHIQPKETRSFDVSEIIQNQVPDAEGNLVPSTVHQGTAKIAGSLAENQHILVAIESGIYNVRKATCSQNCQECDGYNSFYLVDAPFSVAVNGTHQESAMAQYHSGSIYNMTSGSSWGSSNTTVATVGTGLVTGKAAGSVTMTATLTSAPVDAGYICLGGGSCPESTFQNNACGTVPPTISKNKNLWYFGNGISTPSGFTLGSTSATLTASGGSSGDTYAWSITAGSSKAALQGTTSGQNVTSVQINSSSYSTSANDVTVQLQYTPSGGCAATANFNLSVDSPYKLAAGLVTDRGVTGNSCSTSAPTGTSGFQSLVNYTIMSFLGVQITNIGVNESFTGLADDYIGNNWPVYEVGSFTSTNGAFADDICVIFSSGTPHSLPPQSPLSSVKIDHGSQSWFVGSLTEAAGVEVQGNTLQRYQDHGRHNSISSPVR